MKDKSPNLKSPNLTYLGEIEMNDKNTELQVQEQEQQQLAAETQVAQARPRFTFVPRADIYETQDKVVDVADMPGVDETSVEITLEEDVLSIKGHVEVAQPENYNLAYAEYRIGDYERSFNVSSHIDQDHIEATVKDGVLRLHLPKVQPITRNITIKAV
jgi:HSP20 family molecular chaperone IbpA